MGTTPFMIVLARLEITPMDQDEMFSFDHPGHQPPLLSPVHHQHSLCQHYNPHLTSQLLSNVS